ncbi:MAG: hypothetical protein J7556_19925 [Acidovorax sp.]|nr:hypothetical protein [Acidovorax sp.]
MLTQIEWWGGVLFVLGALAYRMVMGVLEASETGISWHRLAMHVFFLAPAGVLAGYFYPLERNGLQYGYLAVLGASLLAVAAVLVQEIAGGPSADEGDHSALPEAVHATQEGNGAQEGYQEPGSEEPGKLMSLVGAAVLYSPVLVACGLGCAKAWPMAQKLV